MLGSKNSGVGQAMFDVKQIDESGSIDVQKIDAVQSTVNLTSFRPKKIITKHQSRPPERLESSSRTGSINHEENPVTVITPPEEVLPPVIGLPSQQDIKEQFEELMNHDLDLGIELAKISNVNLPKFFGEKFNLAKPRYRVIKTRRLQNTIEDSYA